VRSKKLDSAERALARARSRIGRRHFRTPRRRAPRLRRPRRAGSCTAGPRR
jgi:hypothetical protein